MQNEDLFNEGNQATYCPEDDKLRLYVGRVPREEYEALRKEGWTSTPKQACDFVAVWTPARYDTCVSYAGIVGDEDQSPEDRAADRAERFGGYRDKRLGEAVGHADRYDSGPSVHGFQSQARAERSAARHDRFGARATDAWSKAEYWVSRTAGVIGNALYNSTPEVRSGRIRKLESEFRMNEKRIENWIASYDRIMRLAENPQATIDKLVANGSNEAEARRDVASEFACRGPDYTHPRRPDLKSYLSWMMEGGHLKLDDPITLEEVIENWKAKAVDPRGKEDRWGDHLRLRIAYENQMLEAAGGRSGAVEMEAGGKFNGLLIGRVYKSAASGLATSLELWGDYQYYNYKEGGRRNATGFHRMDITRSTGADYEPPTEESQSELKRLRAEIKAAKPKAKPCPLVNPTDEDAEKLQAIWNAERGRGKRWDREPSEVLRLTQAQYSSCSEGGRSSFETAELLPGGKEAETRYGSRLPCQPSPVCKVRKGETSSVVILTDKPRKPLPASVWHDWKPAALAEILPRVDELADLMRRGCAGDWTKEDREFIDKAAALDLCRVNSYSQFGLTDSGKDALRSKDGVAV